jgi:ectoine hydroxylase-related dioxygenase (phytanoyl-CoA dioxygenase family)
MTVTTGTQSVLTEQEVEQFDRDGYFIIDDPCPPELIEGVITDFEPRFREAWDPGPEAHHDGVWWGRHPGWEDHHYHWQRIRNAWRISDSCRSMALSPRVLEITERLFGRKVKPFQTLNFPVGTEQPAHADSFPFQSDPPGFMCGVWIALEDMDMDNGPLVYYPGSHKLPMPSWAEIEKVTGYVVEKEDHGTTEDYQKTRQMQYAEYCEGLIENNGLQPEYGTIRKGQALLWAPNLLHGGSPQKDRDRTRRSQVTHYFFEGCRVYTPLHTEGDHIYWDYPEWIRDPVPIFSVGLVHDAIKEHVPAGSNILVSTGGDDEMLGVEGRNAAHFPQHEDGSFYHEEISDVEAVDMLRKLQQQGAEYIAFPKYMLWELEFKMLALQDELENKHRGLLRDGNVAAIYQLV